MESLEDRRLLAVVWDRIEPLGSLIFQADVAGAVSDTTTAFLEADQTLTVVAAPDDSSTTLTATVRDPSNVVLATASASTPGETLEIQTIGIAVDGDYTVEITGDGATDYDLSLFRNAAVEVFDTADGSEQDATGSFIPLGSGRFGIVGSFDGSSDGGGGEEEVPPNELLVNGSFESGDFNGWTTITSASPFRPWAVSGAADPLSGGFGSLLQTQPQDGAFVAWNGFNGDGPMEFQMYQDVTIAAGATATLDWKDRVQWDVSGGAPATVPRMYSVEIRDPVTNSVLQNLFSFSTGHALTGNTGFQSHSVDVSAFAGQTVRLSFREQIPESFTGPGQVEIDAISLTEEASPTLELYAVDGASDTSSTLYKLDPNTGAIISTIGDTGFSHISDIDFHPITGQLYGVVADSVLVSIDVNTGAATSIGSTNEQIPDISFDSLGTLYAWTQDEKDLGTINLATGAFTNIGSPIVTSHTGLAFDSSDQLFLKSGNSLHTVNPANGVSTSLIGIIGPNLDNVLEFDPSDTLYTADRTGGEVSIYTINPATGATTKVGSNSIENLTGLAFREVKAEGSGPDVDEYLLDLTGKAGQPIDIAFSTEAAAAGEIQTVTIFEQDFESGLGANESVSGIFVINNSNAVLNNGTLMMGHGGTYTNNEYSYYEVALDLTGLSGRNVEMSFDYAAEIEDFWDGVNVQASVDPIDPPADLSFATSGFPYDGASTSIRPEVGSPAFDGEGEITSGSAVFNLSAFGGQVVNVRFQFGSDGSVTFPGFNMDNLIVTASTIGVALLDTDGTTVLATGMDVSDNFDLGILDFVVPADGVYTVRVSSEAQGAYGIVVTDPLVFDTEPNQPTSSPLRSLDAYDGSLGFLGEGSVGGSDAVDTYEIPLAGGETIGLSTITPFDDPIDGLNLLDPSLEVLDPSGFSVAFDSDSGSDNKNAALPSFTATTAGVYKVIVAAEDDGAGEYVLAVNWAPVLENLQLSADMIFENESIFLTGSYSDQNLGDAHEVLVDWDDPNDPVDSVFAVSAINTLIVGDTFNSTTDSAALEITSLDLLAGEVGFQVTDHQYLDDGLAPGNGTPEDVSTISVTVTDDGGLSDTSSGGGLADLFGAAYTGSDGLATFYGIDPGTGVATPIGPIGFERVGAMDFHPSTGVLYATGERADGSDTHVLITIDPTTGVGTEVGPTGLLGLGFGDTMSDISFRSDGMLFAYLESDDGLGTIDIGTGAATALGGSDVSCCGNGMTFDGSDDLLHVNEDNVHVLNQITGVATVITPAIYPSITDDDPRINSMDFDAAGGSIFASLNDGFAGSAENYLASLDPVTGVVSIIGVQTVDGLDALAIRSELPATTDVLIKNVDPELVLDPVAMINENEAATLTGMITDQGLLDEHDLVIDWDDPNAAADSTITIPATAGLSVGDTFNSTTDGAVLTISAVDLSIGKVSFNVQHVYADDGVAPGNGTISDTRSIKVAIVDDDETTGLFGAAHQGQDGLSTFYSIDAATGVATAIGPTGFERIGGMDFHPLTGVLYATGERADGSDSNVLITIDPSTGVGTEVGPTGLLGLGFGDTMSDISFRSDGTLFAYLESDDGLGTIDIGTGAATALGGTGVSCCGNGMTFDGSDDLLHVNEDNVHFLNQITGVATVITPAIYPSTTDDDPRINAMDFDAAGGSIFASLNDGFAGSAENYLSSLDPVTGVVTIIGVQTVDGLDALAFNSELPATTDVLIKNVDPELALDPVAMINENEAATLTGTITDQGLLDEHDLVVDWDDPNSTIDSTFELPATAGLSIGDTFNSTTDGAVLTITNIVGGEVSFSTTHQYLDDGLAPGNNTPQDTAGITVTVEDDDTGADSGDVSLIVKNIDPVIDDVSITGLGLPDDEALPGEEISIAGLFSDIGVLDAHTVIVDWGASATPGDPLDTSDSSDPLDTSIVVGSGSFTATHTYDTGGIYTITVTVIDDDTGEAVDGSLELFVSGVRLDPNTGELQTVGTSGKDDVKVELKKGTDGGSDGAPDGPQIKVAAKLNEGSDVFFFDPDDVTSIHIVLGDGDDKAKVGKGSDGGTDGSLDVPTLIEGGAGKDKLTGGAGPDTIFGGDGKDKIDGRGGDDNLFGGSGDDDLKGGKGNDVLSGGDGKDKLEGKQGMDLLIGGRGADDVKNKGSDGGSDGGGDILVAGWTLYDDDPSALRTILNDAWVARFAADDDYDDIVDDLVDNWLTPGVEVFDDGVKDKLQGAKKLRDVFFADLDGQDKDDDKVKNDKDDRVIELNQLLGP